MNGPATITPGAPELLRVRDAALLPCQLVAGDPRHGVVRFAGEVAESAGRTLGRRVPVQFSPGPSGTPHHLHFTERMWGPAPAQAAAHIERLAATVPVSVTLHDLPRAGDGRARVDAYRRVAEVARGVVVSSQHEAALLAEVTGVGATVIPLPVHVHPASRVRPLVESVVALVGFVYPGKGHREAIDAVAAAGLDGLGVLALGGPAPGHADEVAALHAHAFARGVSFEATGYLDEAELLGRCRRAAVPLSAHRQVSASGSIGTWIGAGRRPLVPDGRYGRELDALRPGTITPYPADDLAAAVARAWRAPESTWWGPDAITSPDFEETARAYLAWWRDGVAW